MENETRVAAGALLDLVQAIFETCEMYAGDAHLLADSLVDADLSVGAFTRCIARS